MGNGNRPGASAGTRFRWFGMCSAGRDIEIPSEDRESREEEACIYGDACYEPEDGIVEILMAQKGRDNG